MNGKQHVLQCKRPKIKKYFIATLVLVIFFLCAYSAIQLNALSETSHTQKQENYTRFSFKIHNLTTNHQFKGQKDTFNVTYQYTHMLDNPGFDPKGKAVKDSEYPYFQIIRQDIIDYAKNYPKPDNFYETYTQDIAKYILSKYPQLKWIKLEVYADKYGGVEINRTAIVKIYNKSK